MREFYLRTVTLLCFILLVIPGSVFATINSRYSLSSKYSINAKYAALVMDYKTGQVLYAVNVNAPRHPASLTKMMTLYLTFTALSTGKLHLDQRLPVSYYAASRAPSKIGLKPGQTVDVQDLILAVVTHSANDAATVLAEALGGGDVNRFCLAMTQKARALGMSHTTFVNPTGLPDPRQITTASDLAKLASALIHNFPGYYHYFSTREFAYKGQVFKSHNHMLNWYGGIDGIKTGYVNASGFNIVTSAVRDQHRLIGILMGDPSAQVRDLHMSLLLDSAFQKIASSNTRLAQTNRINPYTAAYKQVESH